MFLGVEIRGNQQQASVANSLQAGTEIAAWMYSVSQDEAQADLFRKGGESFSELSELEKVRYDLLMRSLVTQIGIVQLARDRGLTAGNAEGESRLTEGTLMRLLDQPGFREWWETMDRRGVPRPLADGIDELATGAR